MKMKKSLGQNFLRDEIYIDKIIDSFELSENDTILEIGPGDGSLTSRIAGKVGKFYAVEIDQRLVENLKNRIGEDNFTLFNEDFLKFDYSENIPDNNVKIVGNLPYHVTSPIIFKVMELASELNKGERKIDSLTIMIQKEVAERIVAPVNKKTYGVISVFTRFFCTPEIMFDVPPEAFFPKPKIVSSIIRFSFSSNNPNIEKLKDMELFRKLVKATFLNRRKMLRNTLKPFVDELSKIKSIDVRKRPENLSVEDYISLTNEIIKL